ncbi:MAG TPA: phage capsid protein, partial [Nitrospirota bacterium]|nr:phage capsid protein [Nitrospirota bacterium]
MSMQITEAFVQQYKANIFHLSQQKGSRLRMAVRSESQVGKRAYYERLGATAAIKKLSRHSDTPLVDSAHSRRAVTMEDFEWADLVDEQDKIRTLIDPTNPYAQAAAWAMGRSMDDVLIAAMRGNAFAGEEAGTIVALPLA